MAQAYSLDTEALTKTTIGIDDMASTHPHSQFATVVFRMGEDAEKAPASGVVHFDPNLWARVGPMLAAPVMLEALRAALEWHRGDAWRDSINERERIAWRVQHDKLEEALKVATARPPLVNL